MSDRHRCPGHGCTHLIADEQLLCRLCWRRVSSATTRRFNQASNVLGRAHRQCRKRPGDDAAVMRGWDAREDLRLAREAVLAEAARAPAKESIGV
jgi:hypothetical protein